MEVEQLFVRASESFQDRQYHEGLEVISRCIDDQPENSLLYSNRSLFYAQLGMNQQASKDLDKAIELNHLNYVAYFNYFSLQYRLEEQQEAFDNLCCSLSSLYLLRAKKSRRELDVQRSISYADNNFEAYVLKSLMYLQDGRLSQALNYMEWACDIVPNCSLCKKLKNIIAKKMDPYAPQETVYQGQYDTTKGVRLKSCYKVEGSFEVQVIEKVREFIDIYNDLLGEDGTVTQKVPRTIMDQDKTVNKSKFNDFSGIYEFKLRTSKVNEAPNYSKLKITEAANYSRGKTSSEAPTKQNLPGQDLKQSKQSNLIEESDYQPSIHEMTNQINILNSPQEQQFNQQNLLDGSLEKSNEIKQQKQKRWQQQYLEDHQQNLLDDTKIKVEEVRYSSHTVTPRKTTVVNSKMSSNASSESTSLYPIGNRKKIQFTVIQAQVKNPGKFKDFYVTGNYNSRKGQRLRTAIKKLDGNKVQWFSINPPTNISQIKQTLSLRLLSKQYFSVNDQLIGDGQVEVLRSGQMKIPVYYRAKATGFITLRIDLI